MHIYEKSIALSIKNTLVHIPLLEQHKYICEKEFVPVTRGEMTPIIKAIDESHWIYKILEENFSDDPLKLWSRSLRFCSLKLRDPNVIIRVKPMIYTRQDIDKFDIQTQELLEKKLIEEITSPHSSTAFMVRNHAELKRGKVRMMVN